MYTGDHLIDVGVGLGVIGSGAGGGCLYRGNYIPHTDIIYIYYVTVYYLYIQYCN